MSRWPGAGVARAWPVAVLAAFVAASAWMLQQLERGPEDRPEDARNRPDAFMTDFTSLVMDQQGRPRYRLKARRMEHFPDDDSTELTRPVMVVFDGGRAPWRVSAERGWVTSGQAIILLLGEARIWRGGDDGQAGIELLTRDLRFIPERGYAETEQAVTLKTASGVTTGTGMRLFLDQERLQLMANVRGRFDASR